MLDMGYAVSDIIIHSVDNCIYSKFIQTFNQSLRTSLNIAKFGNARILKYFN